MDVEHLSDDAIEQLLEGEYDVIAVQYQPTYIVRVQVPRTWGPIATWTPNAQQQLANFMQENVTCQDQSVDDDDLVIIERELQDGWLDVETTIS